MRRLLSILLLTAVFSCPASSMLLIQQEGTWDYSVLDFDLLSVWTEVEYADFDWDGAPWSDGQAAFGNGSVCARPSSSDRCRRRICVSTWPLTMVV